MKFNNLPIKYTYILCAFAIMIAVYLISNNEEIGEAMRPDPYSMGKAYYVLLISAGLLSSMIVVLLTQWSTSFNVKIKIWVYANLITVVIMIIVLLLAALLYAIGMSTGHWAFG
jgi:hypothetical protein